MKKNLGFTVLELLITFAIISILGAFAVPAYKNFMRRNYYHEIVLATQPYQEAVSECFKKRGKLIGCNGGSNKIPPNTTVAKDAINSITVVNGVIIATPQPARGITKEDSYILTPVIKENKLTWSITGRAVDAGFAG